MLLCRDSARRHARVKIGRERRERHLPEPVEQQRLGVAKACIERRVDGLFDEAAGRFGAVAHRHQMGAADRVIDVAHRDRSQIARELSIPKKAVKQIVKALREREDIPSWWETQTYKGDTEEKERIKAAYEPYLPVPPVGVHRKIADELDLKPGVVYQAIKTIRAELNLPPYNDPELHASEFEEIKRKVREAREAREAAKAAQAAEAAKAVAAASPSNEQAPDASAEAAVPAGEAQEMPVAVVPGENGSSAE